MDFYHLPAKGIFSVRHARGPQRVGDQNHPFLAKEPEGRPHRRAVDMDAVADQLRLNAGHIERRADHTGVPVGKRRHSVEQVGCMAGPRLKGGSGRLVTGHGVPHRDGDAHLHRRPDELHGTGLLRGHSHQLHTPLCRILKAR